MWTARILQVSFLSLFALLPCLAQIDILTHRYDSARTGANLSETTLNTTNVNVNQFGKLYTIAVDGAVYAQPLYVSNLPIPNAGTHNVLYVATMNTLENGTYVQRLHALDITTGSEKFGGPVLIQGSVEQAMATQLTASSRSIPRCRTSVQPWRSSIE